MSDRDEVKARLRALVEWSKHEVESQSTTATDRYDVESEKQDTTPEVKVSHLPSAEDVGVEQKFVKLCATLAGGVYKTTSKAEFDDMLKNNAALRKDFPDLTVRFYQTGITIGRLDSKSSISLNAPTLAGVIVGETLVLAFRGTVTIKDMIADLKMESVEPWRAYKGLEIQKAYFNLIKNQYLGTRNSHMKDIINYINGKYSKVPNKAKLDGTPIKRILITGHSLGGGLAQVTHFCLKAQGGFFENVVDAIDKHQIEVKTVAFAAPMTTVLVNPSKETLELLDNSIRPNMRNICFKADPVPRGYANVVFILDLLEDIKAKFLTAKMKDDLKKVRRFLGFFKDGLLPWATTCLEGAMDSVIDQAKRYQHVGKVLYYDAESEKPAIYVDGDEDVGEKFRDVKYKPSTEDPIVEAINFHSFLVTEKGLGYA